MTSSIFSGSQCYSFCYTRLRTAVLTNNVKQVIESESHASMSITCSRELSFDMVPDDINNNEFLVHHKEKSPDQCITMVCIPVNEEPTITQGIYSSLNVRL